ncbi:unnamed protein product [Ambrosiozyma monospora]|uniref:Unnamed protein product n=1 Tax=Ambrosiozyma monospora TaxID=43982 RepID=A0A9W6TAN8_AMBMO|nr:unnamed protein product [Ambrosiozyma monospora]
MAKKGRKGHKGAEAVDSPAPAAGDDSEKADTPVQVKQEHADGDSALIEKAGLGDGSVGTKENTPLPTVDEEEQDEENPDDVQAHNNDQDDDDTEDLEISTWKNLTSNTRFKLCTERSGLFVDDKIQMNADALFRETSQMNNFMNYLDDDTNVVLHKNRKYFDENDDPYLIEYDVTGGIPYLKFAGVDHDQIENELLEDMISRDSVSK